MIRYPAVAGYFYPIKRDELARMIDAFLREARASVDGEVIGGIVPHAGYIYSGKTAAYFYSLLGEKKKVVIVGPNHTGLGAIVSVFPRGEWVTPLGYAKIDEALSSEIVENSIFAVHDVEAHIEEHSIEVQLPFLQYLWREVEFVPIVMMAQNLEVAEDLAGAIPHNVLFIASSDFSHYVPAVKGKEMDMKLAEKILELDARGFLTEVKRLGATPCGYGPIATLILWAKEQGASAKLLHFSNSGETNGDFSNVVDYAAIVFYV